jgi:hypothetical protein
MVHTKCNPKQSKQIYFTKEAVSWHLIAHNARNDLSAVAAEANSNVRVLTFQLWARVIDKRDAVPHVHGHVHDLLCVVLVLRGNKES